MENTIVQLFIQSSCSSSRKAKKWLEENQVPHEVVHVVTQGVREDDLKQLLRHAENGFEDIIKKGHFDEKMEDMSFNQLIDHLAKNPTLIKSPIMIQGRHKVLIGYNEEEIGVFLPRTKKLKHCHVAI